MIATKKGFRGKGIGTLVTANLVEEAMQKGIETIVLHATKQGENIYGKVGFREEHMFSVLWYLGT